MKKESGIAFEKGEYENFSGVIMWGETEGMVENACFKLEEFPLMFIVFYSGAWKNGYWGDGVWKDGIWKNGIWKKELTTIVTFIWMAPIFGGCKNE